MPWFQARGRVHIDRSDLGETCQCSAACHVYHLGGHCYTFLDISGHAVQNSLYIVLICMYIYTYIYIYMLHMILSELQAHPGSFQNNKTKEEKHRIDPLQKK